MNQGGEPGHDDYGLPRVDIEIPDDARELFRDVQAYHRELRALRRHQRSRRWRTPLHRTSALVPIVAGCLILAMIAGMVLTMFSANSYFSGIAGPGQASPEPKAGGAAVRQGSSAPAVAASGAASGRAAVPGPAKSPRSVRAGAASGTRLPATTISVAGRPVALRGLTSTALAIIPANCGCAIAVGQLLAQARSAGVTIYLIGSRGDAAEWKNLAPASAPGSPLVAIDTDNVLASAYKPTGLTVLLVDSRGAVSVAAGLLPGFSLRQRLQSLRSSR